MRLAFPLALLAACAEPGDTVLTIQPDADESGPALVATLDVSSPQCARPIVAGYDVRARYTDDDTDVANLRCHVTFPDGSIAQRCTGEHVVGAPGAHDVIAEVTDLDTGATARVVERAYLYPVMEIDFDIQPRGHAFDVHISVPQSTGMRILLSPAENIVDYDGGDWIGGSHVEVTATGTYRVDAFIEQERANGPTCVIHVFRDISITSG